MSYKNLIKIKENKELYCCSRQFIKTLILIQKEKFRDGMNILFSSLLPNFLIGNENLSREREIKNKKNYPNLEPRVTFLTFSG
jgi:hypothetical protein